MLLRLHPAPGPTSMNGQSDRWQRPMGFVAVVQEPCLGNVVT